MNRISTIERDNIIVSIIKEAGKDGIQPAELAKLCDLSQSGMWYVLKRISDKHPEIIRSGAAQNTRYIWVEKPIDTDKIYSVQRYENTNKNNEGYVDMTANTAIKNAEPEKKPAKPLLGDLICPEPGQVWVTEESNGSSGYIYVLSYTSDTAQCIRLFDIKTYTDPGAILHDIRIKLGAVTLLGDLTHTTYKLRKYLVRRALAANVETLMKVRREVATILGIKSFRIEKEEAEKTVVEEKIVEVPVVQEKIVEVPVYKDREVPEGCIDIRDAQILDLQHQLEAWRSIAWGVIKRDTPPKVAAS